MNPEHKQVRKPNTPAASGATECVMPNPPVRYIHPFVRQTRTRTMKVLVLTPPIHNQRVTMVEPARAHFTVRAGLRLPFEGHGGPRLKETMSFGSPIPPKQRLIIAVPTNMRSRAFVKDQVRS